MPQHYKKCRSRGQHIRAPLFYMYFYLFIVTLNVQPEIIRINQNIIITCTVHGIDIINSNLTRQWSKGPELICYNGHPIDSIKYLEILTSGNQFKLQIKNITESDVNYKYQCRYGFDSQTKNIQASKDNFECKYVDIISYFIVDLLKICKGIFIY